MHEPKDPFKLRHSNIMLAELGHEVDGQITRGLTKLVHDVHAPIVTTVTGTTDITTNTAASVTRPSACGTGFAAEGTKAVEDQGE